MSTAQEIIGHLGELATPLVPYRRALDRDGDASASFYELWRSALDLAEERGGETAVHFGGVRCTLPDSSCIFSRSPAWEWKIEAATMWQEES